MNWYTKLFFIFVLGIGITLAVSGLGVDLLAQKKPLIRVGDPFPEVALKTPGEVKDRAYLEIPNREAFAIKDIKGNVILVEIMNVYCASCQNMVPIYNKLFAQIQANPDLRKKIKIISIAVGNNDQEVKIFRDHFEVPFPIIPDPHYVLHEAIGGGPTPFSIVVRKEMGEKAVLVSATHLGFNERYEEMLQEMKTLMKVDLTTIGKEREMSESKILTALSPFSEEELQAKGREAFLRAGGRLTDFERILLDKGRVIYTGKIEKEGQIDRLFAEVINELPTCDLCHSVHFLYTFDRQGKILQFVPLQLAKYGNKNWDEAEIAKMTRRITGRYIFNPFSFNAQVDAITSATITSAAIFKGLDDGQTLFEELKKRGLL